MSWMTETKTLDLYRQYCEIADRLSALSAKEDWAAVGPALAVLSVLAEGGALEAAEALAEYYAFRTSAALTGTTRRPTSGTTWRSKLVALPWRSIIRAS